jgi:hypothetical protein
VRVIRVTFHDMRDPRWVDQVVGALKGCEWTPRVDPPARYCPANGQ